MKVFSRDGTPLCVTQGPLLAKMGGLPLKKPKDRRCATCCKTLRGAIACHGVRPGDIILGNPSSANPTGW